MDVILEYLKKYWLVLVALVIGIILGLLYAWQINPVEYYDTYPSSLIQEEKVEYLRQTIEAFAYSDQITTFQKILIWFVDGFQFPSEQDFLLTDIDLIANISPQVP